MSSQDKPYSKQFYVGTNMDFTEPKQEHQASIATRYMAIVSTVAGFGPLRKLVTILLLVVISIVRSLFSLLSLAGVVTISNNKGWRKHAPAFLPVPGVKGYIKALFHGLVYLPTHLIANTPFLLVFLVKWMKGQQLSDMPFTQMLFLTTIIIGYACRNSSVFVIKVVTITYYVVLFVCMMMYLKHHMYMLIFPMVPLLVTVLAWALYLLVAYIDRLPLDKPAFDKYYAALRRVE